LRCFVVAPASNRRRRNRLRLGMSKTDARSGVHYFRSCPPDTMPGMNRPAHHVTFRNMNQRVWRGSFVRGSRRAQPCLGLRFDGGVTNVRCGAH
jgi:hypothetical protein